MTVELPVLPAPVVRDGAPYARDELLQWLFDEAAHLHPARPALHFIGSDEEYVRKTVISYAELRDRSLRFAHQLRDRGIKRGDRVIICLPRGIDQYMSILAILWAGATYVPVDWTNPADRLAFIADDCNALLAITLTARAHDFPIEALALDQLLGDVAAEPALALSRADTGAEPDDIAYIIYTSGTTGRPKGVMIRHRNACHFVRAESAILALEPDDIVFGGFSLAFDMSVETMWSAFFVGAEIVVASDILVQSGPDIAGQLTNAGVTVWHVVPSLLSLVDAELPALRLINLGGEACPLALVDRFARPGRRLLNTYGPTETTVTATWTTLRPGQPITIGQPLPGYHAWIVDEALRPVSEGTTGELVIGGHGVGAGYVNRPDLTAEKFTLTPFDGPAGQPEAIYRSGDLVRLTTAGEIEFLGRIDTQVKIRGFRVELAEIESVIEEDSSVAQAIVQLFQDENIGDCLAAFIVTRAGVNLDTGKVRDLVRNRLPNYMRPEAYEVLAALPRLPASGKIDRKALQRPAVRANSDHVMVPPQGPTETALFRIWSEQFAPQPVSVEDDLFEDLGGHSLKVARLVSAARSNPGLERLSIQDVYAAPSVRKLAARIDGAAPCAAAEEQPFQHIADWKRRLCMAAQTIALIPIFTVAGLQWFFPYLAYTRLSHRLAVIPALTLSALAFVAVPPVALLISILIKWLVVGRFKAGDYPLWGSYYFRWWFVRRFASALGVSYIAGTPLARLYLRMMGAKIGRDTYIGRNIIDAPDLVQIGDNAIISDQAVLATSGIERGWLRLGTATIGDNAFVGAMSVVGRGAELGQGSRLDDQSAIAAGTYVPAGENWSGSPAVNIGQVPPTRPLPPISPQRRLLVRTMLVLAALVLPIAVVLPIAPGLVTLIELDWATEGYSFILLAPALAAVYVILMCVLTVVAKRVLLGRVAPGRYAMDSFFYVRYWFLQQLNELALQLVHPIYATQFVAPWYRALGVKVGKRAEISTASAIVPDLVEIGPESFIADAVILGAARIERGAVCLQHTRIGKRTFIGNSALLPAGSDIGDDVLIGVLSRPPACAADAARPGGTWFGSPPISLPVRQTIAVFDEGARFNPSKRLMLTRLLIESVRAILSLTVFVALFSVLFSIVGTLDDLPHGIWWIAVSFPFLFTGFAIAAGAFVIVLKWLVIGRYRATTKPLWSLFVWRTELVTATYENLAVPNLLEPLRGTFWLPLYLRLLGCKIGKRCYIDTTDITEPDLIEIGDDVALNDFAGLQTHLFEDRVMKVNGVKVGDRATIGSLTIILYGAEIGADAQLGDLSVVMKGERLPPHTSWEGSPAQPARAVR
jgi:non-ribosomal peptide synthetase-like protein